jgi:hypothetical protein
MEKTSEEVLAEAQQRQAQLRREAYEAYDAAIAGIRERAHAEELEAKQWLEAQLAALETA